MSWRPRRRKRLGTVDFVWRWASADPRDVVDLAGAGELGEPARGAGLGEELRRWRGIVARRRLVVLARRHAAVALALAVLLEIAAQLGAIPQWVVVAVPLALFLVAVTAFSLRGPSPFGLARLLDDKLGLNDRLATALEIEARGGEAPLERRTVADAAALLAAGREDWHASAAPAGREWWALVGTAAAVAAVVAIGALSAGSSSSGRVEALGPHGGGRGGEGAPESEYAKHVKKHSPTYAPTGKLRKIVGKKGSSPSAEKSANSGYQKIPQAERTGRARKGRPGKGESGAGNSPRRGSKMKRGANSEIKGGEEKGDKPAPAIPKEKEHPTLGFNVKSKGHGNNGRRGTSRVSGPAGKKTAPNGNGDETTAGESESSKKGGTPTGANHAGGEQGNNQQGRATPVKGQASQAVRIQPSYAPSRSNKAGKERKKGGREEGAGGKARTAQVTGATQVGERFSFVPVTGGAVPGPGAGLQLNYLESLKWIERLPWG
jgi:hypothetical protein